MGAESELHQRPEEYLKAFDRQGHDVSALVDFYEHIDFTGSPMLTSTELDIAGRKFGKERYRQVLKRSLVVGDNVFLRGRGYYPGYVPLLNTDALEFIEGSLDRLEASLECIAEDAERCETMADKIFVSQPLDHRKNLSLLLLTGLFESMLQDRTTPSEVFNRCYDLCQEAVTDYYGFIISRKIPGLRSEDIDEIVQSIDAPTAYQKKKALSREMDHPGRILLYCANLCSLIDQPYDFSVNPLRGAAEIGFALKTIGEILGSEAVGELNFVRYSTHDERHGAVTNICELMEGHVPKQLWPSIEKMQGKDTIIIDDNITGGNTLKNLKRALEGHCRSVDVSVVEINRTHLYEILESKGQERRVFPTKKMLPAAIGEWRDQRAMIQLIERRLRHPGA